MSKAGTSHSPQIFDRHVLNIKQARRISGEYGFLRQRGHDDLLDRLACINREFESALYIGDTAKSGVDLGAKIKNVSTALINVEETLNVQEGSQDLIVSNLCLHRVNDLPGLLVQIRRSLKPDGLFLASMFGGETLYQLRDVLAQTEMDLKGGVSPRVFPFADKQQMGALMQRTGFALPVVDSELITVTYNDLFRLMYDLRGMGESNIIAARDRRYVGRDFFPQAAQTYAARYSEADGKIEATFEVIYLCGWAPHESQQKPSPRGSGQVNLTEIL